MSETNYDFNISRYLDENKSFRLFSDQGIYFCRLDLMQDLYELPLLPLEFKKMPYYIPQVRAGNGEFDPPETAGSWNDHFEYKYSNNFFISCWTVQEYESYALWEIYNKKSGCKIDVRFSDFIHQIKKIFTKINCDHQTYKYFDVYFGNVAYYKDNTALNDNNDIDITKIHFDLLGGNNDFYPEKFSFFDGDIHLSEAIKSTFQKINYYDFEKEFRILIHFGQTELKCVIERIIENKFDNLIGNMCNKKEILNGFTIKYDLKKLIKSIVYRGNIKIPDEYSEISKKSDLVLKEDNLPEN